MILWLGVLCASHSAIATRTYDGAGCPVPSEVFGFPNKARDTKITLDNLDDINHDIALGELVSHIDDAAWMPLWHQCSSWQS